VSGQIHVLAMFTCVKETIAHIGQAAGDLRVGWDMAAKVFFSHWESKASPGQTNVIHVQRFILFSQFVL